jgi:hypothetical protein
MADNNNNWVMLAIAGVAGAALSFFGLHFLNKHHHHHHGHHMGGGEFGGMHHMGHHHGHHHGGHGGCSKCSLG